MSTQPALPLSSSLLSPAASGRARRGISTAGLSLNGVFLFATSLLVIASGFTSMRPIIFDLSLHPYLVPVALAFPVVLLTRIGAFPPRVGAALIAFVGIYMFSILSGGGIALGEVVKIGSAVLTIVTCALLVQRRGDFVAGVLGLSIAVALLAVNGLQEDATAGVEAMQGANRNSYSLFALPAVLMAGFVCVRVQTVPVVFKTVLIACTLPALAAIFMSANRSGYLGAVLVGLMLFWDRRGKGLLLVGVVAAAVMFWIVQFGSTAVFDQRMQQTMEGTESDDYRRDILWVCLQIGMENPMIGVSPQLLPFEIGRRTSIRYHNSFIDSHNVFGHLLAGSGVFCILAVLALGWTMWSWKPRNGIKMGGADDPLRDARRLMRMMVVLWVVRGVFTREILYNPSFNIALGLCIGLCVLAELARGSGTATGHQPLPASPLSHDAPPRRVPRPAR